MKMSILIHSVILALLCAGSYARPPLEKDGHRRDVMRLARLRSELKRDAQKFYKDYVEGKFKLDDGKPVRMVPLRAKVLQIVDDSTMLVRQEASDWDDRILLAIVGVDTSRHVDDQLVYMHVESAGRYQYTTTKGVEKTIAAMRLAEGISFEAFEKAIAAGADFVKPVNGWLAKRE